MYCFPWRPSRLCEIRFFGLELKSPFFSQRRKDAENCKNRQDTSRGSAEGKTANRAFPDLPIVLSARDELLQSTAQILAFSQRHGGTENDKGKGSPMCLWFSLRLCVSARDKVFWFRAQIPTHERGLSGFPLLRSVVSRP